MYMLAMYTDTRWAMSFFFEMNPQKRTEAGWDMYRIYRLSFQPVCV